MRQALEHVVVAELDSLGYDLVELHVRGSRARPILDLRIDRRDLQSVQVGDCERASRAIEARLDALPDAIAGRYVLEVSSPGVERLLRTVADWRRFVGRRVNLQSVRLAQLGGRAEVEIVAVRGDGDTEEIVVRESEGREHSLSLGDVTEARLAFR